MNKLVRAHPVAAFFALAFLITISSAVLTRLMLEGVIPRTNVIPAIAPFGPTIAGVCLTIYLYGTTGFLELVSRLWPGRMGWFWPIVCVSLPLVLLLAAVAIWQALGNQIPTPNWSTWHSFLVGTLWSALLGAGLSEEFGWRGFALPHLQRNRSALVSSLMLGFVWALWHFPPAMILGQPVDWMERASYIPAIVAMTIFFTAVYNSTGGSLLAVMLLHGANNASWRFVMKTLYPGLELGGNITENLLVGMLWMVVATVTVRLFGSENLSRLNRQVAKGASAEEASA